MEFGPRDPHEMSASIPVRVHVLMHEDFVRA